MIDRKICCYCPFRIVADACCNIVYRYTKDALYNKYKQVYRRRYESRRSSKPKLHFKKNYKIWRKTIFNMADGIITPCNVTSGSEIMTVNSPSGGTLQCDTLIWDDMPWNSPKRPPCWNSTSSFDFDYITAVDMAFCTSLQNFIQIGPSRKK